MTWTPELIDKTVKAWNKGMSAQYIAGTIFRGSKTRSAVIGWVHRNQSLVTRKSGLSRTGPRRGAVKSVKRKRAVKRVSKKAPKQSRPINKVAPVISMGLTLVDLQPHSCRHPLVNVALDNIGEQLFCGNDKTHDSSYCEAHHDLCHTAKRGFKRLPKWSLKIEVAA